MSLETLTKKELVELVNQLKDKVLELQSLEKKVMSEITGEELPEKAVGAFKDELGNFNLVEVQYNRATNASKIGEITKLHSTSFQNLIREAKLHLGFKILEKLK